MKPYPSRVYEKVSKTFALALFLFSLAGSHSAAADSDTETIKREVAKRLPGVTVDHVVKSPVKGVFEVGIDGGDVVYVSADGRYLLSGTLIDLVTQENLTERVLSEQRVKTLGDVPEESMIIFEPEAETKHTITTFTDIDCPYCRKMHRRNEHVESDGNSGSIHAVPESGD
jgi:thiol:disulfide interchange protein DsbC